MRFGIRSVSMENMAEALGMSKKTLYQYFADKDELVVEVVKRHTDVVRQQCEQIAQEAQDAIHEIFLIMERVMEDFRNMNPMVLFDLQKYHPMGFQRFNEYKNQFLLDFIRCNIQRGIREGLYRDNIQLEINQLIHTHGPEDEINRLKKEKLRIKDELENCERKLS